MHTRNGAHAPWQYDGNNNPVINSFSITWVAADRDHVGIELQPVRVT